MHNLEFGKNLNILRICSICRFSAWKILIFCVKNCNFGSFSIVRVSKFWSRFILSNFVYVWKGLKKLDIFGQNFNFRSFSKLRLSTKNKSFYVESWVQYLWFFSFGKISPKSRKGVEKYFKFIRLLNILSGRYCSYTKLLLFFTFLFYKVKKSVI